MDGNGRDRDAFGPVAMHVSVRSGFHSDLDRATTPRTLAHLGCATRTKRTLRHFSPVMSVTAHSRPIIFGLGEAVQHFRCDATLARHHNGGRVIV